MTAVPSTVATGPTSVGGRGEFPRRGPREPAVRSRRTRRPKGPVIAVTGAADGLGAALVARLVDARTWPRSWAWTPAAARYRRDLAGAGRLRPGARERLSPVDTVVHLAVDALAGR